MNSTAPITAPIIAIVGPTASGKSDLGLALAARFDGEIINCDSVQVYRGLYVATAKVPPAEQRGIPHHLIDLVEPVVNFTAVAWAEAARVVITNLEARGKRPYLVGGTGFYLNALATKFFEAPPIDTEVTAHAWMGAIYGLTIQWLLTGDPNKERIIGTLPAMLMRSVQYVAPIL